MATNSGTPTAAALFQTMNYQMNQMSAQYEMQQGLQQASKMQEALEAQVAEMQAKQAEAQKGNNATGIFSPTANSESAAGPWSDPNLIYSLNFNV